MERLKIIICILIVFGQNFLHSQTLSDREAIIQKLSGQDIDGKFRWRPKDPVLKSLALEIIQSNDIEIKDEGLYSVTNMLTGDEYDNYYDSIFINHYIKSVNRDFLFKEEYYYLAKHLLKSLYSESSLKIISSLSYPNKLLQWDRETVYYLSFLNVAEIEKTLFFLKNNIGPINRLHYLIYNTPNKFDTLEINVCLARIGAINDTLVVNQLMDHFNQMERGDYQRFEWLFEKLIKIRSVYAFQKIGNFLISDLDGVISIKKRRLREMSLSAFLVYVKNFPDRSLKIQETINMWTMVQFSKSYGKDFSTDEYMEMARNWYIQNKDNLVLDYDKY